MALISLEQAAIRLGVPQPTIEEWGQQGLVNIQPPAGPSDGTPASSENRYVEEDELIDVAESLGWLSLSAGDWDGPAVEK
jgi:hypothetical protein